jgi:hypothetical protein
MIFRPRAQRDLVYHLFLACVGFPMVRRNCCGVKPIHKPRVNRPDTGWKRGYQSMLHCGSGGSRCVREVLIVILEKLRGLYRQQVKGWPVARIGAKNLVQKLYGCGLLVQTHKSLSLQEFRGDQLTLLKVILEKQHCWQRGGEIIDPCREEREFIGKGQQIPEELFRSSIFIEPSEGERRIVGHLRKGTNAHGLEIAFERGGRLPILRGQDGIASSCACFA